MGYEVIVSMWHGLWINRVRLVKWCELILSYSIFDHWPVSEHWLKWRDYAADGNPVWRVVLDPVSDPGPFVITVTIDNQPGSTLQLTDVLFGDVWMCAGQSNMQYPVSMVSVQTVQHAVSTEHGKYTVQHAVPSVVVLLLASCRQGWGWPWLPSPFSLSFLSTLFSCWILCQQSPTPVVCCCSPFSSHSFQNSLNAVLPSNSHSSLPP